MTRRASLWLPPLLYMATIFALSAQPDPLPEVTVRVWDKLLHFTEYALLGLLFARALIGEGAGWLMAALLAILLTSAYGVSDEYHQRFVPNRTSDVHDWMADTVGAGIGAAGYSLGRTRGARDESRRG